jgi:hypothetical protein
MGELDGYPITHLNGKVIAYVGDTTRGLGAMFLTNNKGKDSTLFTAKAKYDPKYGKVSTYSDMS